MAAALALVAALLGPPPATAAGKTYFVSPGGSGTECTTASRCEIGEAVNNLAGAGDSVSLAGGRYALPVTGLTIDKKINIGAPLGETAILETTETGDIHVSSKAKATLHDVRIEGEGGLRLFSGSADRVFVAYVGVLASACELEQGTVLRNSVCWGRQVGYEEEGTSHAISIVAGGAEGLDEPVVLRSVTAYAENEDGNAIHVSAGPAARLTVDAANVIARSVNGIDVVAEADSTVLSKALVNIVNSDFGELADAPAKAQVTPLGTSGNISGNPTFADPVNGDFHVGGGSPTLDGGLTDGSAGSVDLEGHERSQARCFGATPVPDMGAFERSPTEACPPPPPPPPIPAEPRKPVFRVLGLVLNKKTGGGRILVEVPGAGTLSLTGSGVKLVRRTAPAEGGVISLPIQAWAITRVRLKKTGKTKVHLRVAFEGRDSGLKEWAKAVQLRKKNS